MKRYVAIATRIFLFFYFLHFAQICQADSHNFEQDNCTSRLLTKGEGCFVYEVKDNKTSIPVYYYIPAKLNSNTQIVFAMHGENRNARDYRNDWRKIYNHSQSNLILLAPQFGQNDFPGYASYNLGNMFTKSLIRLKSQDQWAFSDIENIFDFVNKSEKLQLSSYYIYGHSAGAQFVHRMVIFMPHTRIRKAVAAEAGSYTIPNKYIEYPCGLKKQTGNHLPLVELKTAFSTPMTIILGKKDNKPLSDEHDTYSCDAQQGSNRLNRGEYFYTQVKKIANSRNENLSWTLKQVTAAHIVAHTNPPIEDPMLVSCAALEFFPNLKGINCN
ncbi:hypothetical protein GTQ43_02250 [Nostoc sp. KVJ3]|uniref:hypothetical protein n=1 Tax=Nostoc sp. KVJ3 TaxID=457945 RepID=UPI0022390774|nr:hypothetical protein [Nostoc sp. KVJ3]MCW5312711.1 hypothetical protein [Nostoc sp. KVJ3]